MNLPRLEKHTTRVCAPSTDQFLVAMHPELSNSMSVKYITLITQTFLCLFALQLMAPVNAPAGYPEWQPPKAFIFGMPYIGHAVKPNRKGLVTEILKAVFEGAGYELEHQNLPYKRALTALKAGKIHCTLDVRDKQKGVVQGKTTMLIYDLAVAYLRKTGFKDIKELAGQRVAYMHGFDIQALLPVKIKPQQTYDLSSAFHMLDRGHVSYILDDDVLLKDAMFESKLASSQFAVTKLKAFEVRPIFPDTKEGRVLRDLYDKRMQEMIKNGDLWEILTASGLSKNGINNLKQLYQ